VHVRSNIHGLMYVFEEGTLAERRQISTTCCFLSRLYTYDAAFHSLSLPVGHLAGLARHFDAPMHVIGPHAHHTRSAAVLGTCHAPAKCDQMEVRYLSGKHCSSDAATPSCLMQILERHLAVAFSPCDPPV
jgi:hypothetical protein